MNRRKRLRRTALLCLHCLRNFAFCRAAAESKKAWADEQFWITVHNDFLDIGILEWCKIFGDERAKHAWRKSVGDKEEFLMALLDHIRLTQEIFYAYIQEMRTYRDKFVAHLDEEEQMQIPNLSPAIKSAQFLYQHLLNAENDCDAFQDASQSGVAYFREFLKMARDVYIAKNAD